jgi:hypothetical protein
MLALPDALGHMTDRMVDRVVILIKATLPVSGSRRRIVADRVVLDSLLLAGLTRPKEQCDVTTLLPVITQLVEHIGIDIVGVAIMRQRM